MKIEAVLLGINDFLNTINNNLNSKFYPSIIADKNIKNLKREILETIVLIECIADSLEKIRYVATIKSSARMLYLLLKNHENIDHFSNFTADEDGKKIMQFVNEVNCQQSILEAPKETIAESRIYPLQ
jgi:hypothetical protein